MVNAAHAAHVQAIDSVYGDVADVEGLLRWGEASRAMGFEGMGCIHPMQIEVIHRAFAPTASELEKALKIVAAYEDAQARGLGVVSLGSKMIDAPVVQRALKLVARAKQMGLMVAGCELDSTLHPGQPKSGQIWRLARLSCTALRKRCKRRECSNMSTAVTTS